MQRIMGNWLPGGTNNIGLPSEGLFSGSLKGVNPYSRKILGATSEYYSAFDLEFDSANSPNARTGDRTFPRNYSVNFFIKY